jgi:GNAT superfamily N-acetyltransferase
MTRWLGPSGYWITDDTARIDVAYVHNFLSTQSYWAKDRPLATTQRAITGSLNLSLFTQEGVAAGFCRWVTDGATFAWLCDVFVDPAHRGRGLGVFLVQTAVGLPEVVGLRRLLGTRDAHDLYAKFDFTPLAAPERFMEIWPSGPQ